MKIQVKDLTKVSDIKQLLGYANVNKTKPKMVYLDVARTPSLTTSYLGIANLVTFLGGGNQNNISLSGFNSYVAYVIKGSDGNNIENPVSINDIQLGGGKTVNVLTDYSASVGKDNKIPLTRWSGSTNPAYVTIYELIAEETSAYPTVFLIDMGADLKIKILYPYARGDGTQVIIYTSSAIANNPDIDKTSAIVIEQSAFWFKSGESSTVGDHPLVIFLAPTLVLTFGSVISGDLWDGYKLNFATYDSAYWDQSTQSVFKNHTISAEEEDDMLKSDIFIESLTEPTIDTSSIQEQIDAIDLALDNVNDSISTINNSISTINDTIDTIPDEIESAVTEATQALTESLSSNYVAR